jgi:hypothetical protein
LGNSEKREKTRKKLLTWRIVVYLAISTRGPDALILAGVTSSDKFSDPLFWPLLLVVAMVAIFVAGFVIIVAVMARSRGVHIQHAETGGSIENKPRSTPTLDVGGVNVDARSSRAAGAGRCRPRGASRCNTGLQGRQRGRKPFSTLDIGKQVAQ